MLHLGLSLGLTGIRSVGATEPELPNMLTAPDDLANAAWSKTAMDYTDQGGGVFKLTPTTATGNHRIFDNSGKTATVSRFRAEVKADGYTQIGFRESAATGTSAAFDLAADGSVIGAVNLGGMTFTDLEITELSGGYYRVSASLNNPGAGNTQWSLHILNGYTLVSGEIGNNVYTGDATSGILVRDMRWEDLS